MAKTPSNMLPLGTIAPDFTLLNPITGQQESLKQHQGSVATVILFICNHCPYVIHIQEKLVELAKQYLTDNDGVSFIAINSNDIETYPDDSPENMVKTAQENQYPFPYLFDEDQTIAKAYDAACTPDCYLFDANLALVYRGQFDDSRPGNDVPVSGDSLGNALDRLLAGEAISPDQHPSMGCNIKWRD